MDNKPVRRTTTEADEIAARVTRRLWVGLAGALPIAGVWLWARWLNLADVFLQVILGATLAFIFGYTLAARKILALGLRQELKEGSDDARG